MRTCLVAFAFAFACAGAEPAPIAPPPAPRGATPAPLVVAETESPIETVNEPTATEPTPTAPAPTTQTSAYVPTAQDELFLHQVVTFLDEMVVMMEATQDNCDRMADGLELLLRNNQALIAQAKLTEKDPLRDQWFKQQAEARMMKVIERLLAPMQKCQGNKRVQEAFSKFG